MEFKKDMNVDIIKKIETEKADGLIEEMIIGLKSPRGADNLVLTLKGEPEVLNEFVRGTNVVVEITQAQRKLE